MIAEAKAAASNPCSRARSRTRFMSYAFICIRGVAIPAAPGQSPERAAHWRIRRKRFLPNGGFRGCLGVGCVRTSRAVQRILPPPGTRGAPQRWRGIKGRCILNTRQLSWHPPPERNVTYAPIERALKIRDPRSRSHSSAKKKAGYPLEIGRLTAAGAKFIFRSRNQ